jgi:large subunit ribosomal protein L17
MDKLFGELRQRYLNREGGYTRVVRTEPRSTYDQAETSILELVDGPKDTRFMMTAKTVARDRLFGRQTTPVTQVNIKKVTQFRGEGPFEDMVRRFMMLSTQEADDIPATPRKAAPVNTESSRAAEVESQKTATMGEQIVPDSYKSAASKAEK